MATSNLYYSITLCSLNQTPLDIQGNKKRIVEALQTLSLEKQSKTNLVLFPELCVSGYGCEDAFFSPAFVISALRVTQEIAYDAQRLLPFSIVIVGLPFSFAGGLYNCSAVIANGKLLALVPKTILAGDGVHYETRWFCAYTQNRKHKVCFPSLYKKASQEEKSLFGLMAFSHNGVRFIIENCRDAWGLCRPSYALWDSNFDLVLNPSASHFALDKHLVRRNIFLESSRRLLTTFVFTNPMGCEAGSFIYDGHMVVASQGQLLKEKITFSYQDFCTSSFSVDLGPNRAKRLRLFPSEKEAPSVIGQFSPEQKTHVFSIITPTIPKEEIPPILSLTGENYQSNEISDTQKIQTETKKSLKNQKTQKTQKMNEVYFHGTYSFPNESRYSIYDQFVQSISLGLFDYLRKSKNRGFVLSLSGGADSTSCAILVHRMLAYAIAGLGYEKALYRLGRSDLLGKVSDPKANLKEILSKLMPHILQTIYQSTKNSTEQSELAAQKMAEALGSHHRTVNIDSQIELYKQSAEKILERPFKEDQEKSGKESDYGDDVALQNIQARCRSPLPWLLANTSGSILLCTSNRSEAAVGYSTVDGDMAGGLAPIGGVDKSFLLKWLSFMESKGDNLLGPIPELHYVLSQKPSAELRPNQNDEDDLMPYELLDRITAILFKEQKSPSEIFNLLLQDKKTRHQYGPQELEKHIAKYFKLFYKNQWKRERLVNSFSVDTQDVSPRSYYRFPILNAPETSESLQK